MKAFMLFLLLCVAILATLCATGCVHPHAPAVVPLAHPKTAVPNALAGVAISLDWMIALSVLAVGAGLGLFFFCPAAHRLSIPLAAVGGGIEVTALVLRVSLWFVPWLAGGLGAVALLAFLYELWRKRGTIDAEVSAAAKGTKLGALLAKWAFGANGTASAPIHTVIEAPAK